MTPERPSSGSDAGSTPSRATSLPRIIVITDWAVPDLLRRVERCLSIGDSLAIQHRHPGCPARTYFEEARSLAELISGSGCRLFVNGRLDVALALGCSLHLPARGLSPVDARAHLPPEALVSVAVHDEGEAAEAAEAAAVDLALVSPVFAPGSKPGDTRTPLGLEGFLRLRRLLHVPAFALGGMDETTVDQLPPDTSGIALVSAVWAARAPETLLAALLSRIGR
jgi:thiamine-phosphate pyrophosphorylase